MQPVVMVNTESDAKWLSDVCVCVCVWVCASRENRRVRFVIYRIGRQQKSRCTRSERKESGKKNRTRKDMNKKEEHEEEKFAVAMAAFDCS